MRKRLLAEFGEDLVRDSLSSPGTNVLQSHLETCPVAVGKIAGSTVGR